MSILLANTIESRASSQSLGHPSTLQYWINKLWGGSGPTLSGVDVTQDSALTYSAYWRAIDLLSGIIGFLPLKMYRKTPQGKDELIGNPVAYLLSHRPNEFMDARVFRKTLTAHYLGTGNGYAEIEFDGSGRPIALWPLPPDKTEPKIIDREGKKTLIYRYDAGDRTYDLDYDSVLHIQGLGFDGIKGYSLIHYAAESIGLGLAAEKYSAAFFGNSAMPAGLLKTDAPLEKDIKDAYRKAWEDKHQSLDHKHRIAILDRGLSWEPMSVPAKDAQLIEARKFSIADLSRWTGIPPHMLFELDKGNYANNEELGLEFKTYSLQDRLCAWELPCTIRLCRRPGIEFFEFVVDGLLRGNTKDRYEAYGKAIIDGWMNRNEVRRRENLNAGPPELDKFLQPLNMVTSDSAATDQDQDQVVDPPTDARDFKPLLETAWSRIVTKETRAISKPPRNADFELWVGSFYSKLQTHIVEVLSPVLRAMGVDDDEYEARSLAYCYCQEHLAAIHDNSYSIDERVCVWSNESADLMVKRTMEKYHV